MVAEHALPRTDVLAWTTAGRPWLDQNWGAQLAAVRCLAAGWVPAGGRGQCAPRGGHLGAGGRGVPPADGQPAPDRRGDLRRVRGGGGDVLGAAADVLAAAVRCRAVPAGGGQDPPPGRAWDPAAHALVGESPWRLHCRDRAARDRGGGGRLAAGPVWRAVRYVLVTVASIAGLLVNPWGVGVLGYALSLPANRVVTGMMTEWGPTNVRELPGSCSWPRSVLWWSPWSGPPRPAGRPSSCSGWCCWGGSRSGRSVGLPGSGWPCRWRCARSPGRTPAAACRRRPRDAGC